MRSYSDLLRRGQERSYSDLLRRGQERHGGKFAASRLDPKFIIYYENGARIKVRGPGGEYQFGTVGVTTGWRPSFLLMHNVRSYGSATLLGPDYEIVGVKTGGDYMPTRCGLPGG